MQSFGTCNSGPGFGPNRESRIPDLTLASPEYPH